MRRILVTYILMILTAASGHARIGEDSAQSVTYGIEWGYMPSFFSSHDYYFFDPDGYFRVYESGYGAGYFTNAEVNLHVGWNIGSRWNLSLHSGYAGAADFSPVIPITLRATRFWGDNHLADRWFTFGELGSGLVIKEKPQEIAACKFGGGYRLSLSKDTKMDFIAALRALYTHPEVVHYGKTIDKELLIRNDGYVGSLYFGISLTF